MPKRSRKITMLDDSKLEQVNPLNLELLQGYEDYLLIERNLSPKTINSYRIDLKGWFIYVLENQKNKSVLEINTADLYRFIAYCKTQGNNTKRIKGRMACLSAFYKYLKKKKLYSGENPMDGIDRPKDKNEAVVAQTFLTREQVELMKQKLEEYGDLQLRVYALFSLSTMARVNAVSNVTWKQIDFDKRIVENVVEKEGYNVTLLFSQEVKELLLQLKEQREKDGIICDYVFITKYGKKYKQATASALWDWCNIIGKMLDVPIHPHSWRKSGATLLKHSGCPLETISKLLNHKSTDVTLIYIKEDTSQLASLKDKYGI